MQAPVDGIERASHSAPGTSWAQVCFAWVLTHPEVTSCFRGPEGLGHIDGVVPGSNVVLLVEAVATLDYASQHSGAGRA